MWDVMTEEFRTEDQADAWDFVQYLLQQIQRKELPQDDTSFTQMFGMIIEQSWTCEKCGAVSPQQHDADHPNGLGIGIDLGIREPRRGLTFFEYLQYHFTWRQRVRCESEGCEPTVVEGKEAPQRTMTKRITQTPEVLLIHPKRFLTGPELGRDEYNVPLYGPQVKLKDVVAFEEYLNIGAFTKHGDDVLYRLDGVVAHMGRDVDTGHYIAVVREPDGVNFVTANDDVAVRRTSDGRGSFLEMRNTASLGSVAEPYVFFYSKV